MIERQSCSKNLSLNISLIDTISKVNKLKLSYLAVILQALTMIVLLIAGTVTSTEVVIIYALETFLIGIFHVVKMLLINFHTDAQQNRTRGSGIGLILFFIMHYGFFVFIQTGFFFLFLSVGDNRIKGSFDFSNYLIVSEFSGVRTAAFVITISLFIKLLSNFIQNKRYLELDLQLFMFVPYVRILIQQFTAIIPGFFIILFDTGVVAAILLILLRMFVDLILMMMRNDPKKINSVVDFLTKNAKDKGKAIEPEAIRKYIQLTMEE